MNETKDQAIDRVERNANREWRALAQAAVGKLAVHRPEFTTDDVWDALEEWEAVETHEPRAMGAVMRTACRAGAIAKSGMVVPTRRKSAHGRDIPVWKSKIYKGES